MKTLESYQLQDELYKMKQLLNRAVFSSSCREKNQYLTQLRNLSSEFLSRYERVEQNNNQKQKEYDDINNKLNEAHENVIKTKQTLEVLKKLRKKGLTIEKSKIINEISVIENELKERLNLERPNLLSESTEKKIDDDLEGIYLWDIKLQRYEELACTLQKRVISVEDNQVWAEKIADEFGSVQGLIDTFYSLTEENARLKKDETEFLGDPIGRRRNYTHISPFFSRALVSSLQKELMKQNHVLDTFDSDSVYLNQRNPVPDILNFGTDSEAIDFDSISHDSNFIMSAYVPPSNSSQREKTGLTLFEALEEMKTSVSSVKEQVDKLEEDLSTLREYVVPDDPSSKTRYQLLVDVNHTLMDQMKETHLKIDSNNIEISNLLNQFDEISQEKFKHQSTILYILKPYIQLRKDHFELLCIQTHDHNIDEALASVASRFSLDILHHDNQNPNVYDYLHPKLLEDILKDKLNNGMLSPPKPVRKNEKRKSRLASSRYEPLLTSMKKVFQFSKDTPIKHGALSPIESTRSPEEKQNKPHPFLLPTYENQSVYLRRLLAQCLTSRLAEIDGYIYSVNNKSHMEFIESWKIFENSLKNDVRSKLYDFEMLQTDCFAKIQFCGNHILRKTTINAESMTAPQIKLDMETQIDDPTPKKPTKGKPIIVKPNSAMRKKKL